MTKIVVVGLAVILAAAGSAHADSTNGKGDQSSSPPATSGGAHSSGSARSPGSGAVHQGPVAPSNRSGSAPVVRHYPTNVNVQNGVQPNLPANWRVQRPLDRSELLARQALYLNRNRVNTVQGTNQSTANTSQSRGDGQVSTDVPSQSLIQKRNPRDGQNNSQNATNGTPTTGSRNAAIEVTNSRIHGGNRVLNFNNANTM